MAKATVQTIIQDCLAYKKIDIDSLHFKKRKVLRDISVCKTPALGFHSDICENCGNRQVFYNSCKNPCCPQCQAVEKETWAMKQEFYQLKNIFYYHVVFTIPSELNELALIRPKIIYDILFKASAETLKEFASDEKYLGAQIGFSSVLHTWGSNLSLHPHIHSIVSGGGITKDGKWRETKKKGFLFPVKAVSAKFKGKFMSYVKQEFDKEWMNHPEDFQQIVNACYKKDWVVFIKEPMKDPSSVIKYLARYTHRIAIGNGRIISHENGKVKFAYKDYQNDGKVDEMELEDAEFIRRFLMHVPPKGFMRIRHYGFLGNRNKDDRFKLLRTLTNTPDPGVFIQDILTAISRVIGRNARYCQCCRKLKHPLKE